MVKHHGVLKQVNHGIPYTILYEKTRSTIVYHVMSWYAMAYHVLLWKITKYYGIPCNSIVYFHKSPSLLSLIAFGSFTFINERKTASAYNVGNTRSVLPQEPTLPPCRQGTCV